MGGTGCAHRQGEGYCSIGTVGPSHPRVFSLCCSICRAAAPHVPLPRFQAPSRARPQGGAGDTSGTFHYAAWPPRPGALQPGSAREALLSPARRQTRSPSPHCAGWGWGREASSALGYLQPRWRPELRHRLCSASSRGGVEPPWAQVPRGPLRWAEALAVWGASMVGGTVAGGGQSAGTQTSRREAAFLAS